MILYITDNPKIAKTINGSILAYQLFDWRIEIVSEKDLYETDITNFNLSKKHKLKSIKEDISLHSEIIAIVTRSNYKMIYELIHLEEQGKKVTIYFWDRWFIKKKKEYIKKLKINNEFEKYLERGFLTKLTYQQLSFLNLQRIEQFIVFLALNVISLGINKETQIHIDNYTPEAENSDILLEDLIKVISFKKNNPIYIVDKLMYHSREGHISDPFLGKLKFLTENNTLKKMYDSGNKGEEYILTELLKILGTIMPNTDILKTCRFLIKNNIVFINEVGELEFEHSLTKEDIRYYLPYISKQRWADIYLNQNYSFSGVLPSLQFGELSYSCPVCGSTEYRITPLHFFCSDSLCRFQMDRIIKPAGLPKKITDWDFKRLIKYKHTIVKNRMGGYSRFFLIENDQTKGKYHAIPQIEGNNVGKKD